MCIRDRYNTFFWEELCPTLVVYVLTMVLGVVGNSLIVFTILRYRRMKSTTNVFLASLASADLLLIIFCIPVKVSRLIEFLIKTFPNVYYNIHVMSYSAYSVLHANIYVL